MFSPIHSRASIHCESMPAYFALVARAMFPRRDVPPAKMSVTPATKASAPPILR
ncbi:hypothetical protein [Methanoculleus chikugoensis]|uniref:hypothetical protein n=1 Tax=Methanoculleus chikugoensis TaxID=118126 RepID=UPI001FB5684E|nr:hypothetical protein [Methanoculleus chikugoensis]